MSKIRGTTILAVRHDGKVVVAGDGQVTLDTHVIKHHAKKVRKIYKDRLARDWRTDKYLRRLEAIMIAVDDTNMYLLSGNGDVIEPDEGVIGIGSGGQIAQAAAMALIQHAKLDARGIVEAALKIAASICIYTNPTITIEEI
jgi:ATP-dependent HslUV protease subunit HslV